MADKKETKTEKKKVEKAPKKAAKKKEATMQDAMNAQLEYDKYRMSYYEGKTKDTSKFKQLRKAKARILTAINNGK